MSLNLGNQDSSELHKFDQDQSRWWDSSGPLKTLHHINPVRIEFIKEGSDLAGKTVCDVGCGGGILTESLTNYAGNVTGIDLNVSAIETAVQHAEQQCIQNIQYQVCATEDFANQHPASFDVLCCMEMLEHVPDPEAIVSACFALLKPGGTAFFATINRSLPAYLKSVVAAEHIIGLLPKGTHDYGKFITPAELSRFCRTAGFNIESIKGLAYLPFINRAWLTDQTDTNYMLRVSKPRAE